MGKPMNTFVIVLLAILVVTAVGTSLVMTGVVQMTAIGDDDVVDVPVGVTGESAIVSFTGYDEAGTKTQVAGTLYVNRKDADGLFTVSKESATAMSSSASTDVDGLLVGESIQAIAFDSTYYGVLRELEVINKRPSESLTEYKIASTGSLTIYAEDEDGTSGTSDTRGNLTLAGDSTGSVDSMNLKNDDNDKVFNVKGICFDVVTATNISDITMSSKWTDATTPKRLKSTCDYFFELSSAEMIFDFDTFKSDSIEITSDADNPSETITGYFVDYTYFQSEDLTIQEGYERDNSANTDVGCSDKVFYIGVQ